jgi:hypothetical protein
MKVDLQDMSLSPMEYISNCQAGTEEGEIVNLHPHFTIPEDQLHKDRVFPWLLKNDTLSLQLFTNQYRNGDVIE